MKRRDLSWILVTLIGCFVLSQQIAAADVVLKTMVVNPSQTRTQTTTLKAYLPYEAKPEDIIDLGDLEIDYDIEEGLYYVYKVVELGPGESVVREVRLKDIWVISQSELETYSLRARELVDALKRSAHFRTAVTLSEDITEKQTDIIRTQSSVANALPQARIGTYRQNEKKVDAIKSNLAQLEKLFLEHKLAVGAGPTRHISVEKSWTLIVGVIIALGLLSLAFFVIWHKQAGLLQNDKKDSSAGEDGA